MCPDPMCYRPRKFRLNLSSLFELFCSHTSHTCGLRVERIDPLRFLAGCLKRRINQVLSVFSPSFYVSLRLYVFCLSVDLVKLSVLVK